MNESAASAADVFQSIPQIDVQPILHENAPSHERAVCIDAIRHACSHVGFFYIHNHGISEELQQRIWDCSQRFFALCGDDKDTISMKNNTKNAYWGYSELGGETTLGKADWHECIDIGPLSFSDGTQEEIVEREQVNGVILTEEERNFMNGKNLWPSLSLVGDDWRSTVEEYYNSMNYLGGCLRRALCESLGLQPTAWDRLFSQPFAVLRLLHYPPLPSDAPSHMTDGREIGDGIGPHRDYGCLTFLLQDGTGGLQVC